MRRPEVKNKNKKRKRKKEKASKKKSTKQQIRMIKASNSDGTKERTNYDEQGKEKTSKDKKGLFLGLACRKWCQNA